MSDKIRIEYECPYCLQIFRGPQQPAQEIACPFCGYRQSSKKVPQAAPSEALSGQDRQADIPPPISGSKNALPEKSVPTSTGSSGKDLGEASPPPAASIPSSANQTASVFPGRTLLTGAPAAPTAKVSRAGLKDTTDRSPPVPYSTPPDTGDVGPGGGPGSFRSVSERPAESTLHTRESRYITKTTALLIMVAVCFLSAGAGFAAGFIIGRLGKGIPAQIGLVRNESNIPGGDRAVLIQGRITFRPDPLTGQPDRGAVIIFLPANNPPTTTLPVQGLRTYEAARDDAPGWKAVTGIGGAVERADDSGEFMTVLPPNDYYVLIVSRSARRPKGAPIAPSQLAEMRKFFYAAEDLVGNAKYYWAFHRFERGQYRLDHNFGLDEGNRTFDPVEELQVQ